MTNRSRILTKILFAGLAVTLPAGVSTSCYQRVEANERVIVIGLDGLDPRLCERMMDRGELPHFAALRAAGGYRRLGTSIPPQSPVAWANFITGGDAGAHGIFDFIHRDPARQCFPYLSFSETVGGDEGWEIDRWRIPLTFWPFNHQPTQTFLRRHGKPFWDYVDEADIPVWVYNIPAHYPPSVSPRGNVRCLSGMGVPDLLGAYGTYQHFSEETLRPKSEPGGKRFPLLFNSNNVATARLLGPRHDFLKKPENTEAEFRIYRHPDKPWARIDLQGQIIVLQEGEWSDWRRVDFELEMPSFIANVHVAGICRFYLQEVHPNFRLYVTPLNIDPTAPGSQKISEPAEFVGEIAQELGLFYTAGFQEDHKSLSNGVLTDEEYLEQARHVLKERMDLLRFALDHYEDGFLFFYYSSTDLQAHMFWWTSDDPHPVRTPERARLFNGVIENLYREMDGVVGDVVDRYGDEATILAMSDHGFCNFRRQFNLNTWLRDNGYLKPPDCGSIMDPSRGSFVDWRMTQAYGLGLNGLYLNLRTRELYGVVDPSERDALLNELTEKLLAVRDPLNGKPVIAEIYRSDEVYHGPYALSGPDLLIGYHRGYRASWATTLGDITDEMIADNDSAWSADHCIAADQVPGVVFSNKPILRDRPALIDLAPTILEAFGIDPPDTMTGGSLFRAREGEDLTTTAWELFRAGHEPRASARAEPRRPTKFSSCDARRLFAHGGLEPVLITNPPGSARAEARGSPSSWDRFLVAAAKE